MKSGKKANVVNAEWTTKGWVFIWIVQARCMCSGQHFPLKEKPRVRRQESEVSDVSSYGVGWRLQVGAHWIDLSHALNDSCRLINARAKIKRRQSERAIARKTNSNAPTHSERKHTQKTFPWKFNSTQYRFFLVHQISLKQNFKLLKVSKSQCVPQYFIKLTTFANQYKLSCSTTCNIVTAPTLNASPVTSLAPSFHNASCHVTKFTDLE